MTAQPRNAGQTIVVENVVKGPAATLDFGSITVTENWGRLFLSQEGKPTIVVLQSAYPALIAAIQNFENSERADIAPPISTPPISLIHTMEQALRRADKVSRQLGWHRIYDETGRALDSLTKWRAGQ